MAAEQHIYKDLIGDRKAKLKDFVLNPKSADPAGADRTPQEVYTNTTDNQLKYYDDNLDLRYAVPGIVKAIAPTPLDLDYEIGQEWHLDDHSATYKLLDKETVNGVLEAVWVEEKLLIPVLKVTAHLDFYVDWDNGSDSNEGDSANPYKSIQGAINRISQGYDFQNVFVYTINVVSITQPVATVYLRKPAGYGGQVMVVKGVVPDTELDSAAGNMFVARDDINFKLENFKFNGNSSTTFVNGTKGRATFENNTITGSCLYPLLGSKDFRIEARNNKIDNLIGTNLVRLGQYASYLQNGNFEAIGANSFTQVFYLGNYSYCNLAATANLNLVAGATVTGRRFITLHSSSIHLARFDQLNNFGDTRGTFLSSATYRGRGINYTYSHWVEGLAISQSGADLAIAKGEYNIKLNQATKSGEYFGVNVLLDQTISFADTPLDTANEAWVYAKDTEQVEFLTVPPDPDNLLLRVCLGKITTADNATFASVEPLISERSPEFLDSLNAPGSIPNCTIANAVMNNLNGTLAGTGWVFDPATFSTSSPIYTATATGITVSAGGTYKIDAILNSSVPTTGPQRPSIGIRIAINGIERLVTGRSGYIRRAGGHYRASSSVSARVTLNPGDQITMVGFRDAATGVVDCPPGQSELILMKLT